MESTEVAERERAGHARAGAIDGVAGAADRVRSQTLFRAQAEHRLKTSLAVIAGWATTLDERWEQLPESRRREGVGIIRKATEEMADQARLLLEEAAAEMLLLDLEPVRLDLAAVLDVTTTTFGALPGGHVVEHVTSGSRIEVDADPAALQQVLGHLVENAVKYSPAGSRVRLRALRDAGTGDVLLEVEDEGHGIPEGIDVFEPFKRGPGVARVDGVGLGLYIVRNLVQGMGGVVSARRNAGTGSTFQVRLPG